MLRTWAVRLPSIRLTLSVRSFQTPATPLTTAWPPSLPSVPTSRATRVTSDANEFSWSTIVLMVFLSSRISPFTGTVIFLERSPLATAVVTAAILRTCEVRLPAMEFTESVKSFQVPATPFTSAWPPSSPSVPTSRATRVTSAANEFNWSTIVLIVFFSSRISPFTSTVIFLYKSPFATAFVTSAMLRTCHATHFSLPTQLPFRTHFAGHARHFSRKRRQLVHHRINRIFQFENFTLHVHRNFLGQVPLRHRRRDRRDVTHLRRQVACHE